MAAPGLARWRLAATACRRVGGGIQVGGVHLGQQMAAPITAVGSEHLPPRRRGSEPAASKSSAATICQCAGGDIIGEQVAAPGLARWRPAATTCRCAGGGIQLTALPRKI
jgi:hypothetical protein